MALYHTNVLDPQIKALPTVDTASGSVASFDTDLTENLVEVKCQIVAQQSGSGTPSPSNPRPITTYTEMNVSATGKNLLDNTLLYSYSSWSRDLVTVGDYPMNNTNRGYVLPTKNGITYTISFGISADSFPTYLYLCKSDGVTSSRLYALTSSSFNDNKYTFTADGSMYYLRLGSTGSETNFNNQMGLCSYAQLEKGSYDTTYEAFGTTANIPFGQTVAGGVLDVTTGKLRVTHGYATFDGSENWSVYSTYNYHYQITLQNVLRNDDTEINSYSSHFTGRTGFANNNASITEGVFSADANRIRFKNVDCSDLTAWINFVTTQYNNGTPVQVVYKLATPIEIQLDSITLQALLNENNIWCDTGDTEVKFLLTVGKKIS